MKNNYEPRYSNKLKSEKIYGKTVTFTKSYHGGKYQGVHASCNNISVFGNTKKEAIETLKDKISIKERDGYNNCFGGL